MIEHARQQGLKIYNFIYCDHQVNERYLCPGVDASFIKFGDIVVAVYNPYLEEMPIINLQLPTPNVAIDSWYPGPKKFLPALVEGLCYQNFDKPNDPEAEECEVYIQRRVPALSTVIFRIAKDMSRNIAINASTTEFTLTNTFYNVSIAQDILSQNAS